MKGCSARRLTAVGIPVAAGTDPRSLTIDPLGRFVYVANSMSNNISAYTINQTTGGLAPVAGSPFVAGSAETLPPPLAT
jgi:6-phosphogluconolactonase